ncbi:MULTISPECIES: hypothetical protein [Micromonospora]|uniref:Uncharacterized protein n=1 Tax=Micromonospora solifontis TaxID=2487138 RepID=A0ABX9WBY3_9ACTN|nr:MULTISPECIES: hypothetical protein [Micromonospora]NES15309.1 hypothetical protein [Micromonospora sp. PPF5-17B]NES38757.1 hypothetical protein [Micromonospora solifontis]NES56275.1 hypothetical protein [Micromonospora sp. PPF5-6]RNL93541.1 hypothetical protein EFE23_21820 [Micromonospora solifontis]
MHMWNFLRDLAIHIQAAIGDYGQVRVTGQNEKITVEVAPKVPGPCRLAAFLQDEDEITIEFGEMSILDFHGQAAEDLQDACRQAVDAIIDGKVSETVYVKKGVPVRAVAQLRLPDRSITVHTRMGVAPFSRKGVTHDYLPYVTR